MSYNAEVFDIGLPRVQHCEIPKGEEAKIQVILKTKQETEQGVV